MICSAHKMICTAHKMICSAHKMICSAHNILLSDHRKNKMGEVCGTYRRLGWCIQGDLRERYQIEDPGRQKVK
jgi:hypothetical protein